MSKKEYNYKSPENRLRAKTALKRLIGRAYEIAEDVGDFQAASSIGNMVSPWVTIDNVYGVHIYRNEVNGWIADIELKNTPPGVPNIMGTPVDLPKENRDACEDEAVNFLAMIIREGSKAAPEKPETNVFVFHGFGIKVPHEMVVQLSEIKEAGGSDVDRGHVISRLKDMERKHGEITYEKLKALNKQDSIEIIAIAGMAIVEGMLRWPENTPAPPKSMRN